MHVKPRRRWNQYLILKVIFFFGRLCWVTSYLNQFLNFGFEYSQLCILIYVYTVDCVKKFSCVVNSTSVKILHWKLVDKIWLSILSHFSPWHQRTLKMHIFSPSIFWGITCFTLLHYNYSSLDSIKIKLEPEIVVMRKGLTVLYS